MPNYQGGTSKACLHPDQSIRHTLESPKRELQYVNKESNGALLGLLRYV